MKRTYPYTYLYTLTDINGLKIFYVGKTIHPRDRFLHHFNSFDGHFIMEIVGKFIDEEHKLIVDYVNKGHKLQNLIPKSGKQFKIGEKFYTMEIKKIKKPNKQTSSLIIN